MNDLAWVVPYRNDALTIFFKMISYTGEEWFLITFLAIGYWCVNKKLFRDLTILVCISTLLNLFLKGMFQVPRPLVEHLMHASDYSFPSGHAQTATVFWLFLALCYKQTFFWCLAAAMILGQCLSRVYLGVHFPSDVFAGFIIGSIIVTAYAFYRNTICWSIFGRNKWAVVSAFSLFLALYFWLAKDLNKNNMLAGGALLGVVFGHLLEHRFCHYENLSNYLSKAAIVVFGLIALFLLKMAFKAFAPTHNLWYIFIMYFIIGIYMVFLVPAVAKRLNNQISR